MDNRILNLKRASAHCTVKISCWMGSCAKDDASATSRRQTRSVGSYEVGKANLTATNNIDGTRAGPERSALDGRGGWGMHIRQWDTDEAMRCLPSMVHS